MKIIINAEPEEMAYAMGLVVDAMPTFARHPERIGWGWTFSKPGGRSFFVRRTKGGFSATPAAPGSVALLSTRTERDLPMKVGVEISHVGDMRPGDAALIDKALGETLGEQTLRTLMEEREACVTAPDAATAAVLVDRIAAISDAFDHAIALRAWRD